MNGDQAVGTHGNNCQGLPESAGAYSRDGIALAEAEEKADAWSRAVKENTMFQMTTEIMKWVSLPALLIASMFSRSAARYEFLVDIMICLGAIVFMRRAVQLREYVWAAGLVAIAVAFSPLLLVVKIFLLMGSTCIASIITMLVVFRTQPVLAA